MCKKLSWFTFCRDFAPTLFCCLQEVTTKHKKKKKHEKKSKKYKKEKKVVFTVLQYDLFIPRGGARNLLIEVVEFRTRGLESLKMQFSFVMLPKFLQQEQKISSDRTAGCF